MTQCPQCYLGMLAALEYPSYILMHFERLAYPQDWWVPQLGTEILKMGIITGLKCGLGVVTQEVGSLLKGCRPVVLRKPLKIHVISGFVPRPTSVTVKILVCLLLDIVKVIYHTLWH